MFRKFLSAAIGAYLALGLAIAGQEARVEPGHAAAATSIFISSQTRFFTPAALQRELLKLSQFRNSGLKIVTNSKKADLTIEVDRPVFTYDFTYRVTDLRSSVLVASGKVTAIDGAHAAPGIAKQVVEGIAASRSNEEVRAQELSL